MTARFFFLLLPLHLHGDGRMGKNNFCRRKIFSRLAEQTQLLSNKVPQPYATLSSSSSSSLLLLLSLLLCVCVCGWTHAVTTSRQLKRINKSAWAKKVEHLWWHWQWLISQFVEWMWDTENMKGCEKLFDKFNLHTQKNLFRFSFRYLLWFFNTHTRAPTEKTLCFHFSRDTRSTNKSISHQYEVFNSFFLSLIRLSSAHTQAQTHSNCDEQFYSWKILSFSFFPFLGFPSASNTLQWISISPARTTAHELIRIRTSQFQIKLYERAKEWKTKYECCVVSSLRQIVGKCVWEWIFAYNIYRTTASSCVSFVVLK